MLITPTMLRMSSLPDYRSVLKAELETRRARNPRFSLRAFAKRVGLSASFISDVMRDRRGLSLSAAAQIGERLGYSAYEKRLMRAMVEASESNDESSRKQARVFLDVARELDKDPFTESAVATIADWHHFAILELTDVTGFNSDPKWIAGRLGITVREVERAIQALLDLKLLTRSEAGDLKTTDSFTSFPDHTPSEARREAHRQILKKALTAIDAQEFAERDFSTVTLKFDRAKMPEAKALISEFRRTLGRKLGIPAKGDSVYCLGVQLFRLDQELESQNEN